MLLNGRERGRIASLDNIHDSPALCDELPWNVVTVSLIENVKQCCVDRRQQRIGSHFGDPAIKGPE
jgi:hypothetical protein